MPGSEELQPGRTARETAQRAADLLAILLAESPTVADVVRVLRAHGEVVTADTGAGSDAGASPVLTGADIAGMREAAAELRAVFAAETTETAAAVLNDLLARYAHPPRLTTHGGEHPWHLHADAHDDGPWAEWLLTSSCLALAVLLADRQRPPGGVCASPACGRAFVDAGGGSPRRYCTKRCATRERVAAHRSKVH